MRSRAPRDDEPWVRRFERPVGDLVVQYGGSIAHGVLEPHSHTFRCDEVDGVVGYVQSWGCAVGLGDPVCAPLDLPRLAARFRDFCASCGRDTVYAAGSERFAATACASGAAAIEFGETLIFDPRHDAQAGSDGRELRKKVYRARREGVRVEEYQPLRSGRDPGLEHALDAVVTRWLDARHGFQIYVSHVNLFDSAMAGRRWFYAHVGARVVGLLCLIRMEARAGWLLQHLLADPDAPIGITELLVADCFSTLGGEGCRYATFGPAPAAQLGIVRNMGGRSEAFARSVYAGAFRLFHLGNHTHYQRKFQVADVEPTFLVFDPPHVGVRDLIGVMRAFNVSLW